MGTNVSFVFLSSGDKESQVEKAELITTISPESKWKPSYYHSFGMTQNYYIFLESPLQMNLLKLLTSHIRNQTILRKYGMGF